MILISIDAWDAKSSKDRRVCQYVQIPGEVQILHLSSKSHRLEIDAQLGLSFIYGRTVNSLQTAMTKFKVVERDA